jgi:hypothetical protein
MKIYVKYLCFYANTGTCFMSQFITCSALVLNTVLLTDETIQIYLLHIHENLRLDIAACRIQ